MIWIEGHISYNNFSKKINKKDTKNKLLSKIKTSHEIFITRLQEEYL